MVYDGGEAGSKTELATSQQVPGANLELGVRRWKIFYGDTLGEPVLGAVY
jgi:hypothetical protein